MRDFRSQNITLSQEQRDELSHSFKTITSGNYIPLADLGDALSAVGIKIPPYEVRKLCAEWERKHPDRSNIPFHEFEKFYRDIKSKEFATSFKSMVSRKDNLVTHGGMSETSSEGTTHTIRQEEQVAFSHWINTNLGLDNDLHYLLPIDQDGHDLYDKVKDGILLCKIINFSCPDTIDERVLNKRNLNVYTQHENLVLGINSAMSIGCNVVNIGADDLAKGKPHLVLGLLWQIIRIGLFNQVDLQHCPGLIKLLHEGEKLEDMMKLSTEAILLRWVNYHLANAGCDRQIANFTSDIMDSIAYIHLIHQIAPKDKTINLSGLRESDLERRAELMLREADKIRCRAFVSPRDVINGNYKLNIAFVANMFNSHPGLLIEENGTKTELIQESMIEETREEKTYRNWMNSMGVSPRVNWLYSDLCDGLVILQLYDIIKPGTVDWKIVHKRFSKLCGFMEKIENCNYAISLGKQRMRFSLVGIAGQDINDGNATLTLALVWQLMRAYTLSLLCNLTSNGKAGVTPMGEKEIIQWANQKLKDNGKLTSISSFQDSSISDGVVVLDLIDSIKKGCVDYSQVKEGFTDEAKYENAKYAISMARKLGAKIYALPDDIVEVKPKMVMTVFACLMGRDFLTSISNTKNILPCNEINKNNGISNTAEGNVPRDLENNTSMVLGIKSPIPDSPTKTSRKSPVFNAMNGKSSTSPIPLLNEGKGNNHIKTNSGSRISPTNDTSPLTHKLTPRSHQISSGANQHIIFSSTNGGASSINGVTSDMSVSNGSETMSYVNNVKATWENRTATNSPTTKQSFSNREKITASPQQLCTSPLATPSKQILTSPKRLSPQQNTMDILEQSIENNDCALKNESFSESLNGDASLTQQKQECASPSFKLTVSSPEPDYNDEGPDQTTESYDSNYEDHELNPKCVDGKESLEERINTPNAPNECGDHDWSDSESQINSLRDITNAENSTHSSCQSPDRQGNKTNFEEETFTEYLPPAPSVCPKLRNQHLNLENGDMTLIAAKMENMGSNHSSPKKSPSIVPNNNNLSSDANNYESSWIGKPHIGNGMYYHSSDDDVETTESEVQLPYDSKGKGSPLKNGHCPNGKLANGTIEQH